MTRSMLRLLGAPLAAAALSVLGWTPAHAGAAVGFAAPVAHGYTSVGMRTGGGHGYYGHGGRYYGGGWGWGWGLGLGLLLTAPLWAPTVVTPPPPVVVVSPPPPGPPVAVASNRPDPVIYPRNGQSAQQTEADRLACNRWAMTQQAAMADASVFQRAVEACMDGRGYTLR